MKIISLRSFKHVQYTLISFSFLCASVMIVTTIAMSRLLHPTVLLDLSSSSSLSNDYDISSTSSITHGLSYRFLRGAALRHSKEQHRDKDKDEDEVIAQYDFRVASDSAPACFSLRTEEVNFTLVIQLSPIRLAIMEEQCRRWGPHPISLAVDSGEDNRVSKGAIVSALNAMGCDAEYVTVTMVRSGINGTYPVNRLRNAALAGVRTSHAVYVDADFLISDNLYERLWEQREELASDDKMALVIPAFQLAPICDPDNADCRKMHLSILPETKRQLVELFGFVAAEDTDSLDFYTDATILSRTKNEDKVEKAVPAITQFDAYNNPEGHGSTRYQDWLEQSPHDLLPIDCIASDRYEPYLVVRYCHDLPPFQEAFTGYGRNKMTWMQQLRRSGYRLSQLGDSFLVHFPHAKSPSFKVWDKTKKAEGRSALEVETIFSHFLRWMQTNIPDQTVLANCTIDSSVINIDVTAAATMPSVTSPLQLTF